eukprot:2899773-Amphidinium_carterae.1
MAAQRDIYISKRGGQLETSSIVQELASLPGGYWKMTVRKAAHASNLAWRRPLEPSHCARTCAAKLRRGEVKPAGAREPSGTHVQKTLITMTATLAS